MFVKENPDRKKNACESRLQEKICNNERTDIKLMVLAENYIVDCNKVIVRSFSSDTDLIVFDFVTQDFIDFI